MEVFKSLDVTVKTVHVMLKILQYFVFITSARWFRFSIFLVVCVS